MAQAHHAEGRAVMRRAVPLNEVGGVHFSHLEFTFPLRLLAPKNAAHDASINAAKYDMNVDVKKSVGVLFMVSFGGGLVSGDSVSLDVDVGEYTRLLMLTQGGTKVYRERRGGDLPQQVMHSRGPTEVSRQHLRYKVHPNATLILLPAAVTCFARSRYVQTQRVDLACGSTCSLILLDWFTSGRMHVNQRDNRVPEFWHFYLYHSRNEVRINGQVVARDRQNLVQDLPNVLTEQTHTELAKRCEPYTCFGQVIFYGPECTVVCAKLSDEFSRIQQPQPLLRSGGTLGSSHVAPPDVFWSVSPLCSGAPIPGCSPKTDTQFDKGLILRFAGKRPDTIRRWLHEHLHPVLHLIGEDLYRLALG